ncbi:MAG: ABC transporter permease [Dehalococcoidia bacterium]|nr:ABC transporter permease [Dehalococcoidia bacterium]
MTRYLARRVLQILPLALLVVVLTFFLIRAAPGDPITALGGDDFDGAYLAAMRAKYALDRPVHEQLLIYFAEALRGNFGTSFRYQQPVGEVIASRLPATLLLMGTALAIPTTVGMALGYVAARHANRGADLLVSVGALLGEATPSFWLAQMAVIVFAGELNWFPVQGMSTARANYTGWRAALDVAHHLALPALCLGFLQMAVVMRLTRTALREALVEDYVRTARAKGLAERAVALRHALPNALLPVVTVIGAQFGNILTGAVLIEIIFAWPGLGRLLFDATTARDYPLLTGLFFTVSLGVVIANLLTDVTYAIIDPRVRLR